MPTRAAVLAVLVLVVSACTASSGGQSTGNPTVGGGTGGSVAAGDDLCKLLGPADFAAVGVAGTGTPSENNQDNSNVYCVFSGKSAATGGVEFDAFLADTSADAQATFSEIAAPMVDLQGLGKAAFPSADGAMLRTDIPDGYAGIAIWMGKLAFDIGIPMGDQAKDQLIALAKLVLERSAGITS